MRQWNNKSRSGLQFAAAYPEPAPVGAVAVFVVCRDRVGFGQGADTTVPIRRHAEDFPDIPAGTARGDDQTWLQSTLAA
jgi:hypothetical protein